eukprot:scaffold39090_cov30-Cyclotella_meneghiniana.AAC.1
MRRLLRTLFPQLGLMFLRDSPEFLQIPLLSFPQQSAAVATPPHQDLNHPNLPLTIINEASLASIESMTI